MMEIENILKLVNAVSESALTEFDYDEGGVHLKLSKKQKQVVMQSNAIPVQAENVMTMPMMQTTPVLPAVTESKTEQVEAVAEEVTYSGNEVKSPLVGTFYSAPSPDEPAFVKVGDTVKKGQTLAIVEAMKLMNEIESEYDGVVQAILADNEEIVEYGQTLFIIG